MMPLNYSRKSLQALILMEEEDLLCSLGLELSNEDITLFRYRIDKSILLSKASGWLRKNSIGLQTAIRKNRAIRKAFFNNANQLTLAVAMADMISSICIGVSVATVSCILVKNGLLKLCSPSWTNHD